MTIIRKIRILMLLLPMVFGMPVVLPVASAMAEGDVYPGDIANSSFSPVPGGTCLWEMYYGSAVKPATGPGNCNPTDYASADGINNAAGVHLSAAMMMPVLREGYCTPDKSAKKVPGISPVRNYYAGFIESNPLKQIISTHGYGAVPVPAITTLQHQVAGQLFFYFPVTISADVLSPPVFTGKMVLTAADSPFPDPGQLSYAGPVAGNNGFINSQALSCNIGCDTVCSGSGRCVMCSQDNPES